MPPAIFRWISMFLKSPLKLHKHVPCPFSRFHHRLKTLFSCHPGFQKHIICINSFTGIFLFIFCISCQILQPAVYHPFADIASNIGYAAHIVPLFLSICSVEQNIGNSNRKMIGSIDKGSIWKFFDQ